MSNFIKDLACMKETSIFSSIPRTEERTTAHLLWKNKDVIGCGVHRCTQGGEGGGGGLLMCPLQRFLKNFHIKMQ